MTSDQMKKEYSDKEKKQEDKNQTDAVDSLTTIDTRHTFPTRATTTTRATRVVTWRTLNDGDDDGRAVICMLVSVGEKSESMVCVNVTGRRWVVPLSELNKAFTCFDEVSTLRSRLYYNKTLSDSSVVKLSEKETLRTLYDEHDIGGQNCPPISCVLLKSLSDVLDSVGYDFGDFYGGQYVIGVVTQYGKSVLRVIEWRGQKWCLTNETGYVFFGMPLKAKQGASTLNQLLLARKLSSLMMNCKHRVILDALKIKNYNVSLIPLSHVVSVSSLIGLPVDDIVIESDDVAGGSSGSLILPRRLMIGGSVLGGGTTGLRAITAAADDDDDGLAAPLVMMRDLSLYGYGVSDQWLFTYLTHHKMMSLSCTISSPLVKRHFGSIHKPPRLIPLSVLRLIESDAAHSHAYDWYYGPLIGRPLSGYGTSMAWRQAMVTTVAGWWVDKRLPPLLSGVAGCVAVCSWKGQGWFIPWGLARWLGWAGMRGIVGRALPEVPCPVWRGRELRALDVIERGSWSSSCASGRVDSCE